MKTLIFCLSLCFSFSLYADASVGLYPSIAVGFKPGNRQKNLDARAYAQAKASLIKIRGVNSNIKLLGISYNIDDQKNDFLMVTPFTFQTHRHVEVGLDFILDPRNSAGSGIGISLGIGF